MTRFKDRHKIVPAVYVIFRENQKILLLRRANTGYSDGHYSLPAGHIEEHESAIAAAIREAKEEVGAQLDHEELTLAHVMYRHSDTPIQHERVDFYFQTEKSHLEITNCEPEKCSELRWTTLTSLPKNMVPEVRLALEEINAGTLYSDFNF